MPTFSENQYYIAQQINRLLPLIDPTAVELVPPDGGSGNLREGLEDTPTRVAKAWEHWTSGYRVDIPALLKSFEDGAEHYNQLVMVKNIPFYSKCEHHLADIFGTATVAYIPYRRVLGLSKLSRLVDAFARRLQVQERMTQQIAQALIESELEPLWVGTYVRARHMCMESRGICQQGHYTVTQAYRSCSEMHLDVSEGWKQEFLREALAP